MSACTPIVTNCQEWRVETTLSTNLSILEVILPQGTNSLLTSHVPDCECDAPELYLFHVESCSDWPLLGSAVTIDNMEIISPIVGMVVTSSPSFSLYRIVVFPAPSNPSIRMRMLYNRVPITFVFATKHASHIQCSCTRTFSVVKSLQNRVRMSPMVDCQLIREWTSPPRAYAYLLVILPLWYGERGRCRHCAIPLWEGREGREWREKRDELSCFPPRVRKRVGRGRERRGEGKEPLWNGREWERRWWVTHRAFILCSQRLGRGKKIKRLYSRTTTLDGTHRCGVPIDGIRYLLSNVF